jgi:hypothetical protein
MAWEETFRVGADLDLPPGHIAMAGTQVIDLGTRARLRA